MTRLGVLAASLAALAAVVVDMISGSIYSALAMGTAAFSLVATLFYLLAAVESLMGSGAGGVDKKGLLRALEADRDVLVRTLDGHELDQGLGRLEEQDALTMLEPLRKRVAALDSDLEALSSGRVEPVDLAIRREIRLRSGKGAGA